MAPFEDTGIVPEVQQMVTDLKAYKPDVTLSQPAAAGYWTADFLIKALEKAGPNLSREELYNAINGGFTYGAGGALAPVMWPAIGPSPPPLSTCKTKATISRSPST
jgi:ABC-type branched-subunit amino acid transport system substrate-binding protein